MVSPAAEPKWVQHLNTLSQPFNGELSDQFQRQSKRKDPGNLHDIAVGLFKAIKNEESQYTTEDIVRKVSILADEKIKYYKSQLFGFVYRFFSALHTLVSVGKFESSAYLAKKLSSGLVANLRSPLASVEVEDVEQEKVEDAQVPRDKLLNCLENFFPEDENIWNVFSALTTLAFENGPKISRVRQRSDQYLIVDLEKPVKGNLPGIGEIHISGQIELTLKEKNGANYIAIKGMEVDRGGFIVNLCGFVFEADEVSIRIEQTSFFRYKAEDLQRVFLLINWKKTF